MFQKAYCEATKKYTIRTRIRIVEAERPCLGFGRVLLLENMKKKGSITNAAKQMKMSYRKARQRVEDTNKYSDKPLVEKVLGGIAGEEAKAAKTVENATVRFLSLRKNTVIHSEIKNRNLQFICYALFINKHTKDESKTINPFSLRFFS